MMKFETPVVEILDLMIEDVITTSGDDEIAEEDTPIG